jgi:hypothetical protein
MNVNVNPAFNDKVRVYIQGSALSSAAPLFTDLPRCDLITFIQRVRIAFSIPPNHSHLILEQQDGTNINDDVLLYDSSLSVIYAFTDSVPRITQTVERESNFTPHPNVIYRSGRWQEDQGIAYPTGELIDNSLWATEMQRKIIATDEYKKRIDIVVVHDHNELLAESIENPPIHLVVSDNGIGMTAKQITDALTLAYDQSTRFQRPWQDSSQEDLKVRFLNSLISKYGVGLKFAGAYMAPDLSIISKTESMKGVVDLHLSEGQLKEEYAAGHNPWSAQILT